MVQPSQDTFSALQAATTTIPKCLSTHNASFPSTLEQKQNLSPVVSQSSSQERVSKLDKMTENLYKSSV